MKHRHKISNNVNNKSRSQQISTKYNTRGLAFHVKTVRWKENVGIVVQLWDWANKSGANITIVYTVNNVW